MFGFLDEGNLQMQMLGNKSAWFVLCMRVVIVARRGERNTSVGRALCVLPRLSHPHPSSPTQKLDSDEEAGAGGPDDDAEIADTIAAARNAKKAAAEDDEPWLLVEKGVGPPRPFVRAGSSAATQPPTPARTPGPEGEEEEGEVDVKIQ